MRLALLLLPCLALCAADLDRDGIDDGREQQLLERFAPIFYMGAGECDGRPSSFTAGLHGGAPEVVAQGGTLYGQVSPHQRGIEIHYYHLWRADCGSVPHPLDAEHASVLLDPSGERALYWFAAAHQDTLCDASQAARASVINAVDRGPRVWISEGKHASYLEPTACAVGCGQDRCSLPVELKRGEIVNLGEPDAALNGTEWAASEAWPLAEKMASDFTAELLQRLDAHEGSVLSVSTAPRGMRRTIAVSNTVNGALRDAAGSASEGAATGVSETDSAVKRSLNETGKALGTAKRATTRWLGGLF